MNTAHRQPLLTAADLQQLRLLSQRRARRRRGNALSPWSGAHASALRGHGLEFADLRPYQAGDDIRHMDWRATARTGKPTTKIFLEERQRSLHLVVDRSPGMWFGTRGDLKAAVAARSAAVHAFTALASGDAVSGTLMDAGELHFPKTRSLPGVLLLLRAIGGPEQAPTGQSRARLPHDLLRHLTRAVSRRSTIVMISDFAWLDATLIGVLAELARHHTVTALRVVDPAEQTLADAGPIRFVSPLSGVITVIDTGDSELRRQYDAAMQQRAGELHQYFSRAGIRLMTIRTDQDIADAPDASIVI